jgi:transcriptional regulator with XRE-family HTH domain
MSTILMRLRVQRGLSQRALGALAGCSGPTIHRLETGAQKGAHPRTRYGLEQALGVPFGVMLLPEHGNGDPKAAAENLSTITKTETRHGS